LYDKNIKTVENAAPSTLHVMMSLFLRVHEKKILEKYALNIDIIPYIDYLIPNKQKGHSHLLNVISRSYSPLPLASQIIIHSSNLTPILTIVVVLNTLELSIKNIIYEISV